MRAIVAAVAALVLVACSSGGSASTTPTTASSQPSTTTPTPTPPPSPTQAPSTVGSEAGGGTAPAATVPRVLLVGDSTLMAVEAYDAVRALRGFDFVLDAKSCRALGIRSCGDPPRPPNAAETIADATGQFDDVVIMAGYDEWYTSFPSSFDKVVEAVRAKGFGRIIWLMYRESIRYTPPSGINAREAFVRNNRTLREKLATGRFPDVLLADWDQYTVPDVGWIHRDGVHLTDSGALLVADYISRWVASVHGRPCPGPSTVGGPVADPCPQPDAAPPPTNIDALYAR